MTNNKLLAAVCYFSVFFSPLLLPVIVYFLTQDREVKDHAKRALISHLVPTILLIAGFIIFSFSMFSFENRLSGMMTSGFSFWTYAPIIFMLIYALLLVVVLIWNVVQGVKVIK
ncbi:DUF4870 domain-containing protein [Filibacter tadaridae]|uniref:DUF4870 domain-containing protein n=1 Tax=Filibacter tadaridae TaxID=2483811 RepID=A0A3P5WNW0_9BACL|nr:DUF4870 domain-containing protein [Filibacter tadaridae]VDC22662.1 hypothetical protein FILTAD_00831 [Filibacter tadaridae]